MEILNLTPLDVLKTQTICSIPEKLFKSLEEKGGDMFYQLGGGSYIVVISFSYWKKVEGSSCVVDLFDEYDNFVSRVDLSHIDYLTKVYKDNSSVKLIERRYKIE